jgi:hypothetical protein
MNKPGAPLNYFGDTWQDEDGNRLENRVPEIAAALIIAGEAKFRGVCATTRNASSGKGKGKKHAANARGAVWSGSAN